MEYIPKDPAKALKPIKCEDEETQPLTATQFEKLMEAISHYDEDRRRDEDKFGVELKALCLVMRWTGLRITDVLMLPRTALVGNRLTLTTQKTRSQTTPVLPDHAVEALKGIPKRPGVDPGYFFWSLNSAPDTLGKHWAERIRSLNPRLNFKDEHGKSMQFRSHMLRDTFAVEMLLAGVSLEDVSRMLTHKSIKTTEKYYAPWVRARRQQLDEKAIAAMQKMGATFSTAKV
jgi:integrase